MTMRFVFLFFLIPVFSWAEWKSPFNQPVGIANFRKKAEDKKGSRWTLAEWLAQKDRNRMMDLWLGMYTPAPYELFFGGTYQNYDLKVGTAASSTTEKNYSSKSARVGFYALILGLEYEYEDNTYEKSISSLASLNLRILGNSNQGTHLNIAYGVKTLRLNPMVTRSQNYAEAELEIYVERHSGLHGLYRQFVPSADPALGNITGRRWEAGIFADIGFTRVFGHFFGDFSTVDLNGVSTTTEKSGIESGLMFFF